MRAVGRQARRRQHNVVLERRPLLQVRQHGDRLLWCQDMQLAAGLVLLEAHRPHSCHAECVVLVVPLPVAGVDVQVVRCEFRHRLLGIAGDHSGQRGDAQAGRGRIPAELAELVDV